ncbi:hypothetical protein ACHAWF_012389 [Thalassiosira exigua]
MSEVDDLQSFITDCEWKTRKILRESNKRMKDNARSLAAKERVGKLKHSGSIKKPGPATRASPLAKSKSLNQQVKTIVPTTKLTPATPAKEWKGRDKIIRDAYETINSLPANKKSASKPVARRENPPSGIHSSLSASPFCGPRATQAANGACANFDPETDGPSGGGEPAMVTRRTIERDFYIMSKKRGNPPSKRRQRASGDGESAPELKTSVLRKKHRCDERVMKAKKKQAERLHRKFKRLQIPGECDGSTVGVGGDVADDSDSSTSSDEEECIHALHHLVERHIADENARSLKRSNKALASITFKPNVKEFWAQLHGSSNENDPDETLSGNGQVPSVPLHVATQKFYSRPGGEVDIRENSCQFNSPPEGRAVSRYTSPYKKPHIEKLKLVANEPLTNESSHRPPLTLSISRSSGPNSFIWMIELYNPRNGATNNLKLTDNEFNSMNLALPSPALDPPKRKFETIVYHQTELVGREECAIVVAVSNDSGICSKIYRVTGHIAKGCGSVCGEENLIACLRACEVLQLLKKNHLYSALDTEFWLSDSNGMAVWKPLIETLLDHKSSEAVGIRSASIRAYDSLVALRRVLDAEPTGGADKLVKLIHHHSSLQCEAVTEGRDAPLTARISGCSPYSNSVCPGHAPTGGHGVWRMAELDVVDKSDSMFSIWPSLENLKYPEQLDRSQACGFFHYKSLGPQKGDCINVLSSLAFESPVLSPFCFAVDKGYISPPFSEHEPVTGAIPHVHLHCTSLLQNPVESRLDSLLPPPVTILDPAASRDDWDDAPRNADGQVYHLRYLDEFDRDGFRVKTYANKVECDGTISNMVYGISEKAASPNNPTTSSFLTHRSYETCTECLSRIRTSDDYHYIAENDGEGSFSEPYLFATHMSAYNSVHVSRKSISSYRAQERFLIATKEAEQKKMELALKMKAAAELVEKKLKERIAKIEHTVKDEDVTCDTSVAVDMPSSASVSTPRLNDQKVKCDVELSNSSAGEPANDIGDDGLDQIASLLLNNPDFLKAVARKLGIPKEQVMEMDSTNLAREASRTQGKSNSTEENDNEIDEKRSAVLTEKRAPSVSSKSAAINMPTLKLNCTRYRDSDHVATRGDGWKKLPRNETVIGDFSLTKRHVQTGMGGPKFKNMEEERNFIAVTATQELPYKIDPQQFATETKSLFIPDLTLERLQLAKAHRQQTKAIESMLNSSQQQSLEEILQIPVSKTSQKPTESQGNSEIHAYDGHATIEARPVDHVARALLAVKNHNLRELELVLDTEGLSVDTRDQHGNTLFVLACQQGSKKLAKFLLRRGGDINAQNNGGNTALHYLYEYKHASLAEYLIRKGADDSIRNGDGLTVYEGTQLTL